MTGPWDKFFWTDWYSDKGLRLCSYAARGLWMDMLCIAAESSRKGYLINGSAPLAPSDIAKLTGGDLATVEPLLAELEYHAVFSRDRNGTIYNRKMVRAEKIGKKNRENGKLGGNPILCNIEENSVPDNREVKPRARGPRVQSPESRQESLLSEPSQVPPTSDIQQAFADFLLVADRLKLPKPRKLDPDQRRKLGSLLAQYGLQGWRDGLTAVSKSNFLSGGGDRGWKANFSWLLKPGKFRSVLDGEYSDRTTPSTGSLPAPKGGTPW